MTTLSFAYKSQSKPAVCGRDRRTRRRWRKARVKDGEGVGGRKQTEGRASESGLT